MSEQSLETQLMADLKTAMKAGDTTGRDTIRYTMSSLKNARIDKGSALSPHEELAVLQRDAKRRHESIDQFRTAGRADLVEKEEAELAVLERYLPAALSDSEVEQLVQRAIAETGVSNPRELGKLMPVLIRMADGKADGKRLNEAARIALAGN